MREAYSHCKTLHLWLKFRISCCVIKRHHGSKPVRVSSICSPHKPSEIEPILSWFNWHHSTADWSGKHISRSVSWFFGMARPNYRPASIGIPHQKESPPKCWSKCNVLFVVQLRFETLFPIGNGRSQNRSSGQYGSLDWFSTWVPGIFDPREAFVLIHHLPFE